MADRLHDRAILVAGQKIGGFVFNAVKIQARQPAGVMSARFALEKRPAWIVLVFALLLLAITGSAVSSSSRIQVLIADIKSRRAGIFNLSV